MPDDEFFIRHFARERDRGEAARAALFWEELTVRNFDRIAGFVRAFRFPGGTALRAEEREDATQLAVLRAIALGGTFRGTTAAEYRAALKRAVWFACMDHGRALLEHERGIAGSLDERLDGGGDAARYDAALARWLDERAAEEAAAEEAEERLVEDRAFVRWAVSQIRNAKYREVVALSFDGVPKHDIAQALAISMDNVYARHSRGMKELKRILREHA